MIPKPSLPLSLSYTKPKRITNKQIRIVEIFRVESTQMLDLMVQFVLNKSLSN